MRGLCEAEEVGAAITEGHRRAVGNDACETWHPSHRSCEDADADIEGNHLRASV
jgi:hypothetical protein